MQRLTSKLFNFRRSLLKPGFLTKIPSTGATTQFLGFQAQAPKRFYQNPNLVDWHQIYTADYEEVLSGLQNCASCQEVAELMKMNLDVMADTLLLAGIDQIAQLDLELDAHFYNDIIPILLALLPKFDQHNQQSFGKLVTILGYLEVQNDELYEVLENKIL